MRTLRNWKMDPSEIYPRRVNGKEALTPQRREQFIFPVEKDGTAKLLGRHHEFRETARRLDKPLGVKFSVKNFKANRRNKKNDGEARNDFWSIQGDFMFRHHIELRVQLYVP